MGGRASGVDGCESGDGTRDVAGEGVMGTVKTCQRLVELDAGGTETAATAGTPCAA